MPKVALITGITGQDGSYLTELLLEKGYEVHGIVRRASLINTHRIDHIFEKIKLHYGDLTDSTNLVRVIKKVKPDVLSLDKEVSAEVLKVAKKNEIILQGNLDPLILINGGKELEDEVKKIMLQFSKNDHIFNLSHGIMPITPLDNVQKTLDTIKSFNETR